MSTSALSLLPEADRDYLEDKGYEHDVEQVGGFLHLIIHKFDLPEAYLPRTCDLLIRLPSGYPNGNPDMFWTRPDVKLTSGSWPLNADVPEHYNGLQWQRWSRHFPDDRWRVGVDGIDTYIAAVRRELSAGR